MEHLTDTQKEEVATASIEQVNKLTEENLLLKSNNQQVFKDFPEIREKLLDEIDILSQIV